jgi:hypothetical protein
MNRWIKLSISIIALTTLLAFGAWRLLTWKNRHDAERFVADMRALKIGKSTSSDLSKLIKSTSDLATASVFCAPDGKGNCVGIVTFGNTAPFRWAYRLHFVVGVGFRCSIYTENDRFHDLFCFMTPANSSDTFAFVQESDGTTGRCSTQLTAENRYFRIREIPTGFLGVCNTPQAPQELQDLAYKFDFGCFTRIHGCSIEEMLPVLSRKDLY